MIVIIIILSLFCGKCAWSRGINPRKSIRKPEVGETETRIGEAGSGRDRNEGRRSVCCAAVIFQAYL